MNKDTVRFAVISDIHFSADHPRLGSVLIDKSGRILKRAIEELNSIHKPDFTVINGDTVNVPTAYDTGRIRELLGELTSPFYLTTGNHDIPQPPGIPGCVNTEPDLTKSEFIRLLDIQGRIPEGASSWTSEPADGLRIIGLDSTYTGDWGGRISRKQLDRLHKILAGGEGFAHVIFIHHALIHPWERFNLDKRYVLENAGEVMEMLESSGTVRAVISGHMHRSGYMERNGIPYFIIPSLSTYPCGYGLFTVERQSLLYEMMQIHDEETIEDARRLRYEKEEEIPPGMQKAWKEMIEGTRRIELHR